LSQKQRFMIALGRSCDRGNLLWFLEPKDVKVTHRQDSDA
jgi:hypothetical protein